MSIWGNPAMMGGSGGGGGDVPLLTRAAWGALSTAQKRAYGLVAVQDANSGYDRGKLYYGADYFDLLTSSISANVLVQADSTQYSGGTNWGGITLTTEASLVNSALRLTTSNAASFVFNESENQAVTFYAVAQQYESTSGNKTLLGIPYALSQGNLPNIFENAYQLKTSVYGSDVSITGALSSAWHVYSIAIDSTNKRAYFYLDGEFIRYTAFTNSGKVCILGAADANLTNSLPLDTKFMGVVSGQEADATIIANHQTIMTYYGIS